MLKDLAPILVCGLISAVCSVACTEEAPLPETCLVGGGAPTLVLGQGESGYHTIGDEGVLLVHGPQGGYHTTLAVQAQNTAGADAPVLMRIEGTLADATLARLEQTVVLQCDPDAEALRAWGLRLVWDATPDVLHGALASVRVELHSDTHDSPAVVSDHHFVIFDPLAPTELSAP